MTPSLPSIPPPFDLIGLLLLGLLIGSFLNVVIHRVPRRESIVTPRSRCPGCGQAIPWLHNIPVLSWIALRGRCAGCAMAIPVRYPLVEAVASVLLVGVYLVVGRTAFFLVAAPYCLTMLALFVIDLDLQLLPFAITRNGTWLVVLAAPWNPRIADAGADVGEILRFGFDPTGAIPAILVSLAGALFGWGLLRLVAAGYRRARGIDGLGGGDPQLAAMIGAFSGPGGMLAVLLFASFAGVAVGLALIIAGRASMQSALPFGCFLCPAAVLVALYDPSLLWDAWNAFLAVHLFGVEPLP